MDVFPVTSEVVPVPEKEKREPEANELDSNRLCVSLPVDVTSVGDSMEMVGATLLVEELLRKIPGEEVSGLVLVEGSQTAIRFVSVIVTSTGDLERFSGAAITSAKKLVRNRLKAYEGRCILTYQMTTVS